MEEEHSTINGIKEMTTNTLETGAKVKQVMQERKAHTNSDEEQIDRRHEVSNQRPETCIQEGDDEFQKLESMNSIPGAEGESFVLRSYTCNPNEDRTQCIPEDLGTTKQQRSKGPQNDDKISESRSTRASSNTETQRGTHGHSGENDTLSVAKASQSNTDTYENENAVRFADNSAVPQSMNSVNSWGSSMITKSGTPEGKAKEEQRGQSYDNSAYEPHTAKGPKHVTRLKRKLTTKQGDNRLCYSKKIQMIKEKNKKPYKSIFSSSKEEDFKRVTAYLDLPVADEDEQVSIVTLMKDDMIILNHMNWLVRLAEEEKSKGATTKLSRGVGPDTVLCLDTSESMEGAAFQEMISIAIGIVFGIQHVSQVHGIEENIGVVTFGKLTGVALHLTNQYDKVINVLLTLKAKGPSPMFGGIHMALAACSLGKTATESGILAESRVILISDGNLTPDHWYLVGDYIDPNYNTGKLLVKTYTSAAIHLVKKSGHTVYSVPVGDCTEDGLERLSKLSDGHIIQNNELGRLERFAKIQGAAAPDVDECRENGEDEDRESVRRSIIGDESTCLDESNVSRSKMDILTSAFKFMKRMVRRMGFFGDKGDVMEEFNEDLPCIGTRVRRGPNWSSDDQDCNGPGTVVGHHSNNMVWVEWDIGGYRNVYRYKSGLYDVTVVEEERHLAAGEDIAVGCKVKRGKDWTFGDQDGGEGTVGVVCRADTAKTVHVRWPNKTVMRYYFGAYGRFDVELI